MSYRKRDNMKNLFTLLLLLISTQVFSQQWISDSTFDEKIYKNEQCMDCIVVVEFWVEFNKDNAFKDWDKIKGAKYFRIDIAEAPIAKKEYRVRMAPTLIVFKDGIKEEMFKASLDLECPVDLEELQNTIEDIKKADKF